MIKNKDKLVKIFREEANGTVKRYIHPLNVTLKAHIRQLSASEAVSINAIQDASVFQIVVNNRKIEIDMYVEWPSKNITFQIVGVDLYEFSTKDDIKLTCKLVNKKQYASTMHTDWS